MLLFVVCTRGTLSVYMELHRFGGENAGGNRLAVRLLSFSIISAMYWFQAMSKPPADRRPGTPLLKSCERGGMWWIERLSEGAEAAGRTIWLSRGILNLGRSIAFCVCGERALVFFLGAAWLNDEASTFFWI